MSTPVWETLLVDAGATFAVGLGGAAATYVAHKVGWLQKPMSALADWLRKEGGTLGQETVDQIEKTVEDVIDRKLGVPSVGS